MIYDQIIGSPRLFGIETEFFVIDSKGSVVDKADEVLSALKGKLTSSSLTKECGSAMLEHITFPHTSVKPSIENLLSDFEHLLIELERMDLGIFNLSTYPGKNKGTARKDRRYAIKENILGKQNFQVANRCIGFHFHYSLPRNSFNPNHRFFFMDISSNSKSRVLDLFNMYIAIDPAVTALMQSSPYYEGKRIGKDSRAIYYRGDHMPGSLYEMQPEFGVLNEYCTDFDALLHKISERTAKWKYLLKKEGANLSEFAKDDAEISALDSSWKPVKITSHGTIEYRGSDMNSFEKILGLSFALKYTSRHIEKSSVSVLPSEIGTENPFREEDNVLHVPTFDKIKSLEGKSLFSGFESKEALYYSKRFLDYVEKQMPHDERMMLRPFRNAVEEKKTTSDEVIAYVKKRQGESEIIYDDTAKDFALMSHDRIFKDLLKSKSIAWHI
ncbi:MAG: hypothetical protein HGA85_06220 [Nanoarchaeota archaeon]|nr:hypothetical protein [Nanoarchaeota archaeon]